MARVRKTIRVYAAAPEAVKRIVADKKQAMDSRISAVRSTQNLVTLSSVPSSTPKP